MDNEILGKMIIKTTYMKYRDNNTQEGFAEIKLIEENSVFKQYHGDTNIYIIPTDTKFEKEKYYQCHYKYNNNKNYSDKMPYVAINIQEIEGIEITEDFDEYIKNKNICWNDIKNKVVYAPYERTEQYKYIEGWNKEIWMHYTYQKDTKNFLYILPNNKATEIYDLMNDNEKINWLLEDLKKYKQNTREILNEFIEESKLICSTDILYHKRWEKGIELLRSIEYNYEIINKLQNNEIIRNKLEEYAKQYLTNKYEEEIKKTYKELEQIELQIEGANNIILNAQKKIEKINEEKNQYNQEIFLLKSEKENLIKENKELQIKIKQEKIEYSIIKKDELLKFSIESIKYGKDYEQKDKIIIQKFNNIEEVSKRVNGIKHHELIIYPNPKWVSFDNLWSSGFGAIFEMAHENKEELYIVIIQNYNLSPCECWSMPLVNLIEGYTSKLPYTQNIGYPKNLWIYFIESELNEISFPVSKYFDNIFNGNDDE